LGFFKKRKEINPPINIPKTKNRFHNSFFQLYLKKGILAGKQAAHIWRNEDEIPNVLLPSINRTGTVRPISGPATYHGQGPDKISIISFKL
jgi:hypothetical protein